MGSTNADGWSRSSVRSVCWAALLPRALSGTDSALSLSAVATFLGEPSAQARLADQLGGEHAPDDGAVVLYREPVATRPWSPAHVPRSRRSMAAAMSSPNRSGVQANAGTPSVASAAALSWS